MNGVSPPSVTPTHEQIPHVDYHSVRHRLYMSKLPIFLKLSAFLRIRGPQVCNLQAARTVLKEKRQGAKVGVRWDTGEFARAEKLSRQGGIMKEVEIKKRLSMVSRERVGGRQFQSNGQAVKEVVYKFRTVLNNKY